MSDTRTATETLQVGDSGDVCSTSGRRIPYQVFGNGFIPRGSIIQSVKKAEAPHSLLAYAQSRRNAGRCTCCGELQVMRWTGMDECQCYLEKK